MKKYLLFGAAMVASAIIGGIVSQLIVCSLSSTKHVVKAQRFEVVNAKGQSIAVLGDLTEPDVYLRMAGKGGGKLFRPVSDWGWPGLVTFYPGEGQPGILLASIPEENESRVDAKGASGPANIHISANGNEKLSIATLDATTSKDHTVSISGDDIMFTDSKIMSHLTPTGCVWFKDGDMTRGFQIGPDGPKPFLQK
jgi:hypothetical protein